jgi:hypothetical protein
MLLCPKKSQRRDKVWYFAMVFCEIHNQIILSQLNEIDCSGSKQNWRSLARAFAQRLGMPAYALVRYVTSYVECADDVPKDLRNHGHSPHAEPHTYAAMAGDIAHFFKSQGLTSGVNLLGHSMFVPTLKTITCSYTVGEGRLLWLSRWMIS